MARQRGSAGAGRSGRRAGAFPEAGVTSADVARVAGVSRTLVSYVLNDTRRAHVSEENRSRILATARSLGYRPDHTAQALRRGFSNELAVFLAAPHPPCVDEMLGAIQEAGVAGGCVVTHYALPSSRDPDRRREALRTVLARRPRALFCSLLDLSPSELALAREGGVERILVLDVEPHPDLPTLVLPGEEVGRLAGEHLGALGRRRVAVIEPGDPAQRRPFRLRVAGMRKALGRHRGAELEVVPWPSSSVRPSLQAARELAAALVRGRRTPEALYAYSDEHAFPLLVALREKGLEAPRDVAVLGTDDNPFCELCQPGLSTIRFDSPGLAERAVAIVDALVRGELARDELPPLVPSLVLRHSTAPSSR